MDRHLFTEGSVRTCTQALRLDDGQIVVAFWLNYELAGRGSADSVASARSASAAFLCPRDDAGSLVNTEGIPYPPSRESFATAMTLLTPYAEVVQESGASG